MNGRGIGGSGTPSDSGGVSDRDGQSGGRDDHGRAAGSAVTCARGHADWYQRPDGQRHCRTCMRAAHARYNASPLGVLRVARWNRARRDKASAVDAAAVERIKAWLASQK